VSLDQLLIDSQRDLIAAQSERIQMLTEVLERIVGSLESDGAWKVANALNIARRALKTAVQS